MNKRIQNVIGTFFVLGCLTLLLVQISFAQCKPPKYRKGFVLEDSKRAVWMGISIQLEDFAPEKLVCLAAALKKRYHDSKETNILIFSSHWAARHFDPPSVNHMSPVPEQYKAEEQLRGAYYYNTDKHEECLETTPKGWTNSLKAFYTRIDLPVVSKPQCRLQINGRCLIALDDIEYPFDAKKGRVTGTVTLTGTIDSRGIMTGVVIAETNITPVERKILLENEALENIKTWRFEKSEHQDPFRITYSYLIDAPKGYEGMTEVQPELPDHVYIRVNPWKP